MAASQFPYLTLSSSEEKHARQLVERVTALTIKANHLVESTITTGTPVPAFEFNVLAANHAVARTLSFTLDAAFAIVTNPTLKDLIRIGLARRAEVGQQPIIAAANIADIEALTALPRYREFDATYSEFRNILVTFFQRLVSGTQPPVSQVEQAANARVLDKARKLDYDDGGNDDEGNDGEEGAEWDMGRAIEFVHDAANLLHTFFTYPTVVDYAGKMFSISRPPHPHFPDLFAKYGMGSNADDVGALWALVRVALQELFGWPDPNPHARAGGNRLRLRKSRRRVSKKQRNRASRRFRNMGKNK
jgi:hypothetical protein